MAMHRGRRKGADSDWLGAADRLFAEFPDLPLETVVRALNAARRELGAPLNPHVAVGRARELLAAAGPPHRAAALGRA